MEQLPEQSLATALRKRVGAYHAELRLGIEGEHHQRVFGRGRSFFHIENWYSIHGLIRLLLRLALVYRRGQRNALDLQVVENQVRLPGLPAAFDGYRLLHLTDLHLDMTEPFPHRLADCLRGLAFDACVMTGDYRARTYGHIDRALAGLERLRGHLGETVYAVLGNHDSIHMLLPMESLGIRVLVNEHAVLTRRGESLYLVGIDDPHYFRADNLEKAMLQIPDGATRVLLSHSPEMYQHAACAGIDLLLCGHTHGGQICLPGGFPLMCNARAPRAFCSGAWRHQKLQGYTSRGAGTSVVDVRLNCPAEVTVHTLRCG